MSIKTDFETKIKDNIKKEMKLTSMSAIPTLTKVVVNVGVGKMRDNKNFIQEITNDLAAITGQKPSARKAKSSISNFKLRKGQLAGLTVTLRGKKMWDFYEKFVKIVLPRVKDFRGMKKKSFDGNGNYSIGLKEHIVFSEIDPNKMSFQKSLQVTIHTSALKDDSGYLLLKALGMPFEK